MNCNAIVAPWAKPCAAVVFLGMLALLPGCAAPLVVVTAGAAGVSLLDNRTTGTMIEDGAIELKAKTRLLDNRELSRQAHINFTSYNTRVLISGEAPTEELRQQVVDIVKGVAKVSHIHNEVIIAAPSSLLSRSSDTAITAKVKTKLLADRELSGINIKVVTENGTVFLMGISKREDAHRAALIASATGGAQKVVKLFEYTD